MHPATIVLGFVLGSAAAISFALLGTAIVFFTLRAEYPRLDSELGPLLISAGLFLLLTAAAASSFYAELKQRAWRRGALAGLLAMLVLVAGYHAWPRA